MRALLILIVVMSLCGCWVPTATVRSQAVSYDDAIEDTTNKFLVLNILRAKDKAPLHFDEIPSIHESIQATGSLGFSIPYGPRPAAPGRNVLTTGLNVQVSPSFEVDHLDTKDFVTGIASPIDPKFVKYWLDRGLDRRIVLLLFFSAVDIVGIGNDGKPLSIRIRNSPRDAIDSLRQLASLSEKASDRSMRCDRQSDFQHYLRFINTLTTFYANSYIERRELAEGLKLSSETPGEKSGTGSTVNLSSIATLDPNKYQWVRNSSTGTYTVYAVSAEHKTALCDSGYLGANSADTSKGPTRCSTSVYDVLTDDPMHEEAAQQTTLSFPPVTRAPTARSQFCEVFDDVVIPKEDGAATPSQQRGLRLEIRSVGEIIQFLGDLLEYQEQLAKFKKENHDAPISLNDPVTFGYCAEGNDIAGCNDIFFNLSSDSCNSRFTLSYRGKSYSVPNYNPVDPSTPSLFCSSSESDGTRAYATKDHTLEILAAVHQLIDLQKSAQDIRETPYVQVLP
jgi:hypothetical protein